jgi:hypothetical protein
MRKGLPDMRTIVILRSALLRASKDGRRHRASHPSRLAQWTALTHCPARTSGRRQSGAALSPRELDNFDANDAITITTAISAITIVQIALISGFTPNRTSE